MLSSAFRSGGVSGASDLDENIMEGWLYEFEVFQVGVLEDRSKDLFLVRIRCQREVDETTAIDLLQNAWQFLRDWGSACGPDSQPGFAIRPCDMVDCTIQNFVSSKDHADAIA